MYSIIFASTCGQIIGTITIELFGQPFGITILLFVIGSVIINIVALIVCYKPFIKFKTLIELECSYTPNINEIVTFPNGEKAIIIHVKKTKNYPTTTCLLISKNEIDGYLK
jgi:hypothetical protein